MKTSIFGKVNLKDLGKLLVIALGTLILNFLQMEFIPLLDVSPEIRTMLSTAVVYISKNLLTNSEGEFLKKEQ